MFSNLSLVGLSVSLYFYDLRSLLGDDENVSLKNLKNFCRKLYGDTIEQELDEICRRDNPHTNYVNILGDSQKVRILNPILGIDTYPVQMGDVYGCIIEVLGERALRNTARNLNEIHIAKQQIDSLSLSEATVGQTWVVMGKLLDGQDV